jgi:hypothetical protein
MKPTGKFRIFNKEKIIQVRYIYEMPALMQSIA